MGVACRDEMAKKNRQVFGGNPSISRRIYEISYEVIKFHQADAARSDLRQLLEGEVYALDPEIHKYVRDHVLQETEQIETFCELLSNVVSVNLLFTWVRANTRALAPALALPTDKVSDSAWC